ncbi:hypothetical protein [Paraburkholderia fungorum]|uniref:hypothetical protein n=1 Tax=Paraburkholderia fungorum TaxID=134537 RepID=UPI0038B73E4A
MAGKHDSALRATVMCRDSGNQKTLSAATAARQANRQTTPGEMVPDDFHQPKIPFLPRRIYRHESLNPLDRINFGRHRDLRRI